MPKDTDAPVDMIEVTLNGKAWLLTEKDFATARKNACARLVPFADILKRTMDNGTKIHEDYVKTVQFKDGFMKAVSLAVVMKVGSVKFPNASLLARAGSAVMDFRKVLAAEDLNKIAPTLEAAERAVNAYMDDVQRFLDEVGVSARNTGTALAVTSAVGFAVIGALGTGILVAGGATATTAAALSAASVKTLENSINAVAKVANGQDLPVLQTIKDNVIDSTVAAATGGIAGKVDPKLLGPMADAVVKKLGSRLTILSAAETQKLVAGYLSGPVGATVAVTAVNQAVEALGEMIKKGKVPTEKDLLDNAEKFLIALMTAGMMKNLELGEKKLGPAAERLLETKFVPDAVKKLVTGAQPKSSEMKSIVSEVYKSTKENLTKTGAGGILAGVKGNESPDEIAALGTKAIERDAAIQRLIEAEVKKVLKKRKFETR